MADASRPEDRINPWNPEEYKRNAAAEPLLAFVWRVFMSGIVGPIPPKRRTPKKSRRA
jgi:hypothetical protein